MNADREQEITFDPEQIARDFHDAYEEFAPIFNYTTRPESAVPWENVPDNNKRLMIATCEKATAPIFAALDAERALREQAEQRYERAVEIHVGVEGAWKDERAQLEQALWALKDDASLGRLGHAVIDAALAGDGETKAAQ